MTYYLYYLLFGVQHSRRLFIFLEWARLFLALIHPATGNRPEWTLSERHDEIDM